MKRDWNRNALRPILLGLWLGLLGLPATGQHFHFAHFNVEDGLAQSQVAALYQDRQGYMWLGTYGGLAQFNGLHFKTLSSAHGLPDFGIRAVTQDAKGRLWLGTDGGGVFVREVGGQHFTQIGEAQGLPSNIVSSIAISPQGRVWVGTMGGLAEIVNYRARPVAGLPEGLPVFSLAFHLRGLAIGSAAGLWHAYIGDDTSGISAIQVRKLPEAPVPTLLETPDGALWIGTIEAGLFRMKGNELKNWTTENGLVSDLVISLAQDSMGTLWYGTVQGLGCILPDGSPENYSEHPEVGPLTINALRTDREGNLWVGTDGAGAFRLNRSRPFRFLDQATGLPNEIIWGGATTPDGHTWVATEDGLVRIAKDGTRTRYTTANGLPDNVIRGVAVARDGTLWAITPAGAARLQGTTFQRQGPPSEDNGYRNLFIAPNGNVWLMGTMGAVLLRGTDAPQAFGPEQGLPEGGTVFAMAQDAEGTLWAATAAGLFFKKGNGKFEARSLGAPEPIVYSLGVQNGKLLWVGTSGRGLAYMGGAQPRFINTDDGLATDGANLLYVDPNGNLWVGTNAGVDRLNAKAFIAGEALSIRHFGQAEGFLGIECNQNAVWDAGLGRIGFGTVHGMMVYTPATDVMNTLEPITHLSGIRLFFNTPDWAAMGIAVDSTTGLPIELVLPYDQNYFSFDFAALSHSNPAQMRYSYKLEGIDPDWTPASPETQATYPNLPPGTYTFQLRARNEDGIWNTTPVAFTFTIRPPFWQTWWFYTLLVGGGLLGIFSFVRVRLRRLRLAAERLEHTVQVRTQELREEKERVEEQNVVIESQKEELNATLDQLQVSHRELEQKNQDIEDSIHYAQRIQTAILPDDALINQFLPNSFFFYIPKDIVSGDFYWFSELNGIPLVAAVDCTGHGVPGAFMSVIGYSMLNRIVDELRITEPHLILTELDKRVRHALKQDGSGTSSKDGMDLILCEFLPGTRTVKFAGANRPLYVVRKGELLIFNTDRYPIGGGQHDDKVFTTQTLETEPGDKLYLFTDGIVDQFGGPQKRKYTPKRLRELLLEIEPLPMAEQHTRVREAFLEWKGDTHQLDDVTLIGVEV